MAADADHRNPVIAARLARIYAMHRSTIDLRLERSPYAALLQELGHPERRLPPVVHFAGTNGKGSTLAIMRSMLEAQGYKVHAYTSPHLFQFNERIRLAGRLISDEALLAAMDELDRIELADTLTFFEYTTALAFHVMAQTPADICLLETGLGGRLDCTNVVPGKALTVLTTISYDHMEFLGHTVAAIAREKAGIFQHKAPCVVARQFYPDAVLPVLAEAAKERDVKLYVYGQDWNIQVNENGFVFDGNTYPKPALQGLHQIDNAGTALAALQLLADRFPVSEQARKTGLQTAEWAGRLERVKTGPMADKLPSSWQLWYDGGHNDSGAAALADQCQAWKKAGATIHLVVSLGADKDVGAFIAPFQGKIASLTFLDLDEGRKPQTAAQMRDKLGDQIMVQIAATPAAALHTVLGAKPLKDTPQIVLFCGSLYRAASILPLPITD